MTGEENAAITRLTNTINEVAKDVAYMRGKFDENHHTPSTCPNAATIKEVESEVKDIETWRNQLIGKLSLLAGIVAVVASVVVKWLSDLISK